ncbi:hypothetical protein HMPREF3291_06430 [Bacillus sp. HMSC76G11]|nr:hypothetical protein HMPREF3291_06430 [Bacillus sp. HMSC76G11]
MGYVIIDKQNKVAIVTIDNPPMNALSPEVFQEMKDAMINLNADHEVLAIIFKGGGVKAFVAGADIKRLPEKIGNPNLFSETMEFIRSLTDNPVFVRSKYKSSILTAVSALLLNICINQFVKNEHKT